MEEELEKQCMEAVPNLLEFHMVKKSMSLPIMCNWYMGDFGGTEAKLITYLLQFMPTVGGSMGCIFALKLTGRTG